MKNFAYCGILAQAMKKIPLNDEMLRAFRGRAETLIMEGYCKYFDNVAVYCQDGSYATVYTDGRGGAHICMYTDSAAFVDGITELFRGKTVEFCGASGFVTEYLRGKYAFEWETNCYLYVWNGKPLPYKCRCDLRPMDGAYAREISDGTFYRASEEEIRACLSVHPSSAAYVDGKPVCWCLLHKEGSLGMLYTMPVYRRQGYALEVMTDITNKVIASGSVPYCYIVRDNAASISLAAKYNLERVCTADYFEINLTDTDTH